MDVIPGVSPEAAFGSPTGDPPASLVRMSAHWSHVYSVDPGGDGGAATRSQPPFGQGHSRSVRPAVAAPARQALA
jgi:hypothetical protein